MESNVDICSSSAMHKTEHEVKVLKSFVGQASLNAYLPELLVYLLEKGCYTLVI